MHGHACNMRVHQTEDARVISAHEQACEQWHTRGPHACACAHVHSTHTRMCTAPTSLELTHSAAQATRWWCWEQRRRPWCCYQQGSLGSSGQVQRAPCNHAPAKSRRLLGGNTHAAPLSARSFSPHAREPGRSGGSEQCRCATRAHARSSPRQHAATRACLTAQRAHDQRGNGCVKSCARWSSRPSAAMR